ncbi:MAG: hypothetical protein HY787_20285 [Deltaproteobacteria bacterium]|nr:hypothetical protein [Deltaproteobacteria bacterium]
MGWILLAVLGGIGLGILIGYQIGLKDGFNQFLENFKLEQSKRMFNAFMRKENDDEEG